MLRLSLLAAAVAALLVGGAAVAVAKPGKQKPRPAAGLVANAKQGALHVAAQYLGLTRAQLASELRQGKSLAQVATAHGKSVDGLKAVLLAAQKAKIDAAVAAGRIDARRAQRLLERASAQIDRLVARTWPARPAERNRGDRADKGQLLNAAASYLGLTRVQLAVELRQGKTLAQVATAQGKTVEGLKAVLLEAVEARLDAAVAAGRIDAARAQRKLAAATRRIEVLVNRVFTRRR